MAKRRSAKDFDSFAGSNANRMSSYLPSPFSLLPSVHYSCPYARPINAARSLQQKQTERTENVHMAKRRSAKDFDSFAGSNANRMSSYLPSPFSLLPSVLYSCPYARPINAARSLQQKQTERTENAHMTKQRSAKDVDSFTGSNATAKTNFYSKLAPGRISLAIPSVSFC